jgi:hypothetical protein
VDASTSTLFTLAWLLLCGAGCAAVALVPDRCFAAGRLPRYVASPLLVVAVAFVIRLVPAVALKLTPDALIRFDIDSYRIVGSLLRSGQSIYTDPTRHPYLPFEAYAMGGASWLSYHTGDPFTLIVKLPAILADALIPAVLLAWTGRGLSETRARWSAWVYAFNPLTILVVSVHGQFDSVPLFFAVAALWFLREPGARLSRRDVILSGALMGFAILSKTWPLMLVPIAAWQLRGWPARVGFAACAAAVPAAGLAFYALISQTNPLDAINAARAYNGFLGGFGYPLLLAKAAARDLSTAATIRDFADANRMAILAIGVLLATLISLRNSLATAAAVVVVSFYVFTPGWGYHYLVWGLPFMLLGTRKRAAMSYLAVASATLLVVFYWFGGVYAGVFDYFDANSAMVRWRWLVPVPIWAWAVLFFVVALASSPALRAFESWLDRLVVPAHRPRRTPIPR